MRRSVVRSALGRGRLEMARCSISQYPTSTPRHFFSTTEGRQADGDDKPAPAPRSASPQRSRTAGSQSSLTNNESGSVPRPQRLDARKLAASPTPGQNGPKIINLRSLGRSAFVPRGGARGEGAGGDGGDRQPRFGQSGAAREGSRPRMSNAFSKFLGAGGAGGAGGGRGGRGRFTRGGFGGRGGAAGGRGGGGRGGRNMGQQKKKKRNDGDDDKYYKLTWSKDEQAYIDAEEQGVVTKYTPSATLADYAGYGPAIATDSPLGKVESAMRSMRILAGGKPFCADGYYNDDKATLERYRVEKKPVFFDDVREKEWLEKMTGFNLEKEGIQGPDERTKTAIVESAIQGKYTVPKFAEVKNTVEVLAQYHGKQDTWTPTDGKTFDEKVLSLLPTSRKPAAPQQKA